MKKLFSAFASAAMILLLGTGIAAEEAAQDLTLLTKGELTSVHFDPHFEENLTEKESTLYGILEEGIASYTHEMDISAAGYTDAAELTAFLETVFNTHLMWNAVDDKVIYTVTDGVVTGLSVAYPALDEMPTSQASDYTPTQAEIDHALADIEEGMTDVEKALVLHDYLVREVDYNLDVANGKEAPTHNVYTLEGVFKDRDAVCQGYALAYSFLLNEVDIESQVVSSKAMNHAWNLVKLGDYWYHVDVTWDDPVNGNEVDFCRGGYVGHEYFLRSDEEFEDELGHYGWVLYDPYGNSPPTADNSGAFVGYCFRPTADGDVGMLNYVNGYFYCLDSPYGSNGMNVSKIDGTDLKAVTLSREYAYMFYFKGYLYASTGSRVYELNLDGTEKRIVAASAGLIRNFWLKQDVLAYYEVDEEGNAVKKTVDLTNGAANLIIDGNFEFVIDDNGCAVLTGYTGSASEVTIPGTVNGYTVTAIGSSVFKGNKTIEKIVLADSITTIGSSAFYQSSLCEIQWSQNIAVIGDEAFRNCNFLSNLVLPASVDRIDDSAFQYCQRLDDIFFMGDVPSQWGKGVFTRWANYPLVNIHYSEDAKEWTCPTWKDVYGTEYKASPFDPDIMASGFACGDYAGWSYADGTLTVSGTGDMWNWSDSAEVPWYPYNGSITKVVIKDGITSIGDCVFMQYQALTEVSIADSVTRIGEKSFWNCYLLTTITIPENVTAVGAGSFQDCYHLKSVYFYGSVPSEWETDAFGDFPEDGVIQYISGKNGWIPGTWTAPDGNIYTTVSFGEISKDVNGDQLVNAADAAYLKLSFEDPDNYPLSQDAYDYSCDGITDVKDAQYLLWSLFTVNG